MNELSLSDCELPTAKLLLESKKFKSIAIGRNLAKHITDFNINAEEFSFHGVPLEEALKYVSIKTDLLIISLGGKEVKDGFSDIVVRFASLFWFTLIIVLQHYF